MTVWAFVSDVHGNYRALLRAQAICQAEGATRFVSLGDVIGRGAADACVRWVVEHADLSVVGNRDLDHLVLVSADLQQVVLGWPREARASNFIVSHGDARLHRALASSDEKTAFTGAKEYMRSASARLWFFGHTHRSAIWELSDPGCELRTAPMVRLAAGSSYVVNVGTTGKPLARKGPAAATLYDDDAATLRILPIERESVRPPSPRRPLYSSQAAEG